MRQLLVGIGAVVVSWAAAAGAATVERFTPVGEVRAVRQAAARFSEDMVRFGDPKAPAPFDIVCAEAGQGRWIDSRNWVFDFSRDLPPGTRCSFKAKGELRALAGGALSGAATFAFSTGGPAVLSIQPYNGSSAVDEEQVFVLRLNGAAAEASVLAGAWCVVQGIGERVPVDMVGGRERSDLFKALKREKEAADPRLLLLKCRQRMPAGAALTLVWGRGITSAATDPAARVATSGDQPYKFTVRPEFKLTFTCVRENANAPCSPYQGMRVEFSALVPRATAEGIRIVAGRDEKKPVTNKDDRDAVVNGVSFAGPFPENAELTVTLPAKFADDTGRAPVNASGFPLKTRTGEGSPLVKFAAGFGIIERAQPVLPVTVRNVEPALKQASVSVGAATKASEPSKGAPLTQVRVTDDAQIMRWMERLRRAGSDEFKSREEPLLKGATNAKTANLPAPAGGKVFEVIGIALPEPGFHVIEVESERLGAALLGKPKPMYVRAGALVTNMAVHMKVGRESSAIWVTALDTAAPVAGAALRVSDCDGNEVWSGQSGANGVAPIAQVLATGKRCKDGQPAWFVSARKGDDLSFTLSDWQNGIEPWRFNVNQGYAGEASLVAHTVFDRPLFRAGETVSMKHFVRSETLTGLAGAQELPGSMRISHVGSGTDFDMPVKFGARGSGAAEWKIPADAKLGEYSVTLLYAGGRGTEGRMLQTGSFRVAEFRLPLMQGSVTAPKAPQVAPSEVLLDLSLGYLSGGPAAGQPVKITALVRDRALNFPDYEEFNFNPPGSDAASDADEGSGARGTGDRLVVDKAGLKLGPQGTARFPVRGLPPLDRPRELQAEMTYRDPNGEEQTLRSVTALWPAGVVTGIQTESWVQVRRSARFKVVVLGHDGKPKVGAPVKVSGVLKTVTSSRKRTVGGFYSYENRTERKDLGVLCKGETDARGLLLCEAGMTEPGNVELEVRAEDGAGNTARAATGIWVAGAEAWFGGDNADRMDLLPEKKRYNPGETAKFQVRMPFRQATAWVTVEREGVIETLVVPLSGRDPVISVPIKPGYAPNVFVSVLAVRGRLRDVPWYSFLQWGWRAPTEWWGERRDWIDLYNKGQPTALVDLARPAFKMGLAEVQVGTSAYTLKVSVAADKPVYQTRETARVKVSVKGPDGKAPAAGTEVALAAVDQSLLELMPNASWDLLEGMVRRRGYFVETATAQMQVVGRRHFGKKALAGGGSGGRAPTRELFDTLLLWKPVVVLDGNGEALVDVPLNDALTSFRIVAVADAPSATLGALFGTGATTIGATKDLQILAGLPPLVREGDRFRAGVTLRNTTSRAMRVAVIARVEGLEAPLATLEASLASGAAQELQWDVAVPVNAKSLVWTIEAVERSAERPARDAMKAAQKVVAAVPLTVRQATLVQLDKTFSLTVAPPADGLRDKKPAGEIVRGGVRVALQARLSGSQDGVRRYFEEYPFACLEQKTSKSIGLRDNTLWQKVAGAMPNYLDEDGLAGYFPGSRGSDTLTAYVLAASHESGFALPDNARERMAGALIGFVEGRVQRNFWSPNRDLDVRKIAAIEALARYGKATPKLLESITLQPNQWPTHAVIDWVSILMRLPGVPKRDEQLAAAEQVLRARLSMQGTRLVFSTEREDYWWWLMVGGDVNAARLIAVAADLPGWREDLPRLVNGLMMRQTRGAWQTTTANLWGGLALDKFAAKFDSEKVSGTTRAQMEEKGDAKPASAFAWGTDKVVGAFDVPWPALTVGAALKLTHEGAGKPWITIQSIAAVPVKEAFAAGYRITRTVTSVEQKSTGNFTRGDVLRVKLEVDASADMTWVVVADPIPAGATILGAGLARDSQVAQQGERRAGEAWPAYEERSFEGFRAYYEFAPKGKWSVEYTVRLNQDGEFFLPATRVEAMYAPEMFGVLPNPKMKVLP